MKNQTLTLKSSLLFSSRIPHVIKTDKKIIKSSIQANITWKLSATSSRISGPFASKQGICYPDKKNATY